MVKDYRGSGALYSIRLNVNTELLEKVLKLIPINMLQQDRFVFQVINAAFTDWLFSKHHIYVQFTPEGITFSPSLIIQDKEINYFFDAFEESLNVGFLTVASTFISNRFVKFFRK